MYCGQVVERVPAKLLFDPKTEVSHPYTEGLLVSCLLYTSLDGLGAERRQGALAAGSNAPGKSGVVSIAATANSVAALKSDGTILTWGVTTRGEGSLPAFSAKPIKICLLYTSRCV